MMNKNINLIDLEILEDEVISIEEYKVIDTIDIEIDSKNRLFFANDILTHNSGWENSDMSIINVSESAALIMTVDALFGIITSPEMKARGEYMLKYMADRVSGMENTRKKFNVDFKLSRIEEDLNSQIEDLDYIINQAVGNQKPDRGGMVHTSKSVDITATTDSTKIPELNVSGNDLFLGPQS